MKKIIFVLFVAILVGCASKPTLPENMGKDVQVPRGTLNARKGEDIRIFFTGMYVDHGKKNLSYKGLDLRVPDSFHEDNASFMYSVDYYFDGKAYEKTYEVVISGMTINEDIVSDDKENDIIEAGTTIGTATTNDVFVCIRDRNLDPHLVATSESVPVYYNGFWYFGPEILMPNQMKWLWYEPIKSENEKFKLQPYKDLTIRDLSQDTEGKTEIFVLPSQKIMIEVALDEYPKEFDYESLEKIRPLSRGLIMNTFQNCTTETTVTFGNTDLQLFFQEGFDVYLDNEYTLGEPLYLFLDLEFSANGEILCYVRDFSFETGDEKVYRKIEYILQDMENASGLALKI